eukprot:scaffold5231_cov119-Isochrysis_galbana.AAC.7
MRTALAASSNRTTAYSISSPQNSSSACASESARYVSMNWRTPVIRALCSQGSDSRSVNVARCASFPSAHSGAGATLPDGAGDGDASPGPAAPPRRTRPAGGWALECGLGVTRLLAPVPPDQPSSSAAVTGTLRMADGRGMRNVLGALSSPASGARTRGGRGKG